MPAVEQLQTAAAITAPDGLAPPPSGNATSLSTEAATTTELVTETGAPLLDQNGNSILIES